MKVLLAVTMLVAGALCSTYDYTKQGEWTGDCQTGKKQSPIDVITPTADTKIAKPLISLPDSTKTAKMTNLNNDNTVKFSFPANTVYTIPNLSDKKGTLVQLHLHWGNVDTVGSEHHLDGKSFAAEAHLVTTYDSGAKYAVVGRFFKVGAENAQIKQMIDACESSSARDIASFDATAFYPNTTATILQYSGGLTTPGCDEKVFWNVIPEPLTISSAQLEKLRVLKLGSGEGPAKTLNFRAVQDLNGRTITKVVAESSSIHSVISPLLLLAAVIKLLC